MAVTQLYEEKCHGDLQDFVQGTMCRAQQHAPVVAAHDGPCAMIVRQHAFKNATEFLARCFACTVFQIMCLIHQH